MALRYWVGGTANWDGTAGTKWATTDGGTGGASVPTSADDVFFTALSGANTVTIAAGNTGAKSIDCTGFTGAIAGSTNITVSGSVILGAGMTFNYTGNIGLSGTGTLSCNGISFGNATVTINGAGITVTLGSAFISGVQIAHRQGTLDTANYNITARDIDSSVNTFARTLTLGSSTLTLSGASSINFVATNLTFNAGTSQINCSNTSAVFNGAGFTFYNVDFTSTTAGTRSITGNNTFNNLSVTATSATGLATLTFFGPQTINGALSTTSTAGNRRVLFAGGAVGLAQTLTVNATPSLTDADFRDLYIVGTAAPISGTRIGNYGGCSGITFSTPKTVYWVTTAGGNWSGNNWAATSGGGASTDNFPLSQDTGKIENTGLNTSATVTLDTPLPIASIDMSSRTTAMTLSVTTNISLLGSWTNGSGTSISGSNPNIAVSGRRAQIITSAGKFMSTLQLTVNSYGGSLELADAITSSTIGLTVTNGTFDTKGYNFNLSSMSFGGTGVRTVKFGASTLTFSIAGAAITCSDSTNLTFDAGTSQINITNTNSGISGPTTGSALTLYNVSFTNTTATPFSISGAFNFNNLTFTAPAAAGYSTINLGGSTTITNTLTCAGASAVQRMLLTSDVFGTTRTLTVGTLSANDCDFRDITIAGTATGTAPTRAGDHGGNSGVTFPAAKTVYWNLAGTTNWSDTGWATGSGGTPAVNNFPLAQDTAVFDNTGSAGTITFNAAWGIGTLDASARTSAMTLTMSQGIRIYGDWKSGTGLTLTGINAIPLFSKRSGTQTITSNGVQFGFNIGVDSLTGTVQLADALNLASTKTFTLTSGTFDAITYNVTTNFSSISGTRTLKMGTSTWTIPGTGICWNISGTASFTFEKNTANIVLSDTSTTARTFAGGGLFYNKLTIGGTTGISTLTITSNNDFSELASTKTVAHTIDLGATVQTFGAWTVTGTAGNVVTLTGTGTTHVLAGAATSGIDYLAMGSIGFAATSPGEFYAGANSTGTAAAPVYRTAPPTGGTRYWVGGTGNWSDTARWSTSSGGGSGASVPTSLDNVVFDASSNATAYTATIDATSRCKQLTVAGPASGNLTLAGTAALICHDNITLPATGLTKSYSGTFILSGSTTGKTITTNGVSLNTNSVTINGMNCEWSLGSALSIGNVFSLQRGSIKFVTYALTCTTFSSNFESVRAIDFGTGTTTVTGNGTFNFGSSVTTASNLTVTAGTSTISTKDTSFNGRGKTFYNVDFTDTQSANTTFTITGVNTFNNLSFSRGATSLRSILFVNNQTINGTLTCTSGAAPASRIFIRSDTFNTVRTITAAAVSLTDVDFRDITIAGAAAPASGTRLGDCKGNSGVTFPAAKTVYCRSTGSANWSSTTGWSATSGGTADVNQFPLAQDTAVFPAATYPASGSTITLDVGYNIGTIDMSLRTSNTMTLSGTVSPFVYGNWINGTGTNLTGSGTHTFAGRSSQTITNSGVNYAYSLTINSPGGSVTLTDALPMSGSNITLTSGTFDSANYNVTWSSSSGNFTNTSSNTRTVVIGSSTWAISGSGTSWNTSATGLTVTGTGTIKLTSASAKTFAGGSVAYTNITLDQGGAGVLTVTGNNTFKNISNSYSATGATTIAFGTTTQTVSQFTATGAVGKVLTLTGTNSTTPCTLVYTGAGDVTGLDYLTITGVRAYPL